MVVFTLGIKVGPPKRSFNEDLKKNIGKNQIRAKLFVNVRVVLMKD